MSLTPRIDNLGSSGNLIINGAFDFWQRGTQINNITSAKAYGPDRWCFFTNGSSPTPSLTISRQAGPTGFRYACGLQRNGGNTNVSGGFLIQGIESDNIIFYQGRNMVVSFYAKAGANYSPTDSLLLFQLNSGTGIDENVAATYTGEISLVSTNIVLTTSWQRFEFSVELPVNCSELKTVFRVSHVGTAGADDSFSIDGVMLNEGSIAGAFKRAGKTIGDELIMCQRYYETSTHVGNVFGSDLITIPAISNSNRYGLTLISYKTTKRSVPVIAIVRDTVPTVGLVKVVNGAASANDTATVDTITNSSFRAYNGTQGPSVTDQYLLSFAWAANAEL